MKFNEKEKNILTKATKILYKKEMQKVFVNLNEIAIQPGEETHAKLISIINESKENY